MQCDCCEGYETKRGLFRVVLRRRSNLLYQENAIRLHFANNISPKQIQKQMLQTFSSFFFLKCPPGSVMFFVAGSAKVPLGSSRVWESLFVQVSRQGEFAELTELQLNMALTACAGSFLFVKYLQEVNLC